MSLSVIFCKDDNIILELRTPAGEIYGYYNKNPESCVLAVDSYLRGGTILNYPHFKEHQVHPRDINHLIDDNATKWFVTKNIPTPVFGEHPVYEGFPERCTSFFNELNFQMFSITNQQQLYDFVQTNPRKTAFINADLQVPISDKKTYHFFLDDTNAFVRGKGKVSVSGTSKISAESGVHITAKDDSQVWAGKNCTVDANDRTEVLLRENAKGIANENSVFNCYGASSVTAKDKAIVFAHENSHVTATGECKIVGYGNSTISGSDQAIIELRDTAQGWIKGNCIVDTKDNSIARLSDKVHCEAFDNSIISGNNSISMLHDNAIALVRGSPDLAQDNPLNQSKVYKGEGKIIQNAPDKFVDNLRALAQNATVKANPLLGAQMLVEASNDPVAMNMQLRSLGCSSPQSTRDVLKNIVDNTVRDRKPTRAARGDDATLGW